MASVALENDLKAQPLISMAITIGDRRNFMSALLCPDVDELKKFAAARAVKHLHVAA